MESTPATPRFGETHATENGVAILNVHSAQLSWVRVDGVLCITYSETGRPSVLFKLTAADEARLAGVLAERAA